MNKEVLGVDIGNVIIDHRLIDRNDEDFLENRYSEIPAMEGVFDCLRKLNDSKFHGDIFLVSKGTTWAQEKVLVWFLDHDFYNKTGINLKNVFFCQDRAEKEKICRDNNVTHFVDDRLEVLGYMVGVVPNLFLLKPDLGEVEKYKEFLSKVVKVEGWNEIVDKLA